VADRLLFALVDILTASWSTDKTCRANAGAVLTYFTRAAILLLVAAGLAGAVNTDLTLKTVPVRVTNLNADPALALFSPGTVGIYLALEVAHAAFAGMSWRANTLWTAGRNSNTALLWCWHPGKTSRTAALNIFCNHLTLGIGTAGTLLLARIDALKTYTHLVCWAILVGTAANFTDTG
jgi:hypothetical protein